MLNLYAQLQKNLVLAIDQKPESKIVDSLGLQWKNQSAIFRANQLYKILGPPKRMSKEAGGVVIWKWVDPFLRKANIYDDDYMGKPTNLYSKLMIKDEEIPHIVPVPHTDWFYAYKYIDIPDHKVSDVLALTESVGYDTMTKEIYARCHFFGPLLVTLYLAQQIASGHKGLLHAQQEYSILIPILGKEFSQQKGLMAKESVGPWHKALSLYTFGLSQN